MRVFTAILLILLVLLQYRLWFGKNSVPDYLVLKENVVHQVSANEKLQPVSYTHLTLPTNREV